MGKRKKSSRGPVGPKKTKPLPQTFQCLFCNHESSVTIKLDRRMGYASLSCKVCGQHYGTNVHFLAEGVDVYSEWIDACEAVAQGKEPAAESSATPAKATYRGTARDKSRANAEDEHEDGFDASQDKYGGDDFVVDDEGDMEGAYRAGHDDDDD